MVDLKLESSRCVFRLLCVGVLALCVNAFADDRKPENFVNTLVQAPSPDTRLRVIMTTDFPPIGVVKGGDVPNTMKSDPDDMQSMVRFLLYSNEFDVEGLIASAGTFAMEAHKKNILGVIDRYEQVYENLKKRDSNYPTPDYLRSVTFEGMGNNHGIPIKFGRDKQPVTEIMGDGLDSEASNAIIAAGIRAKVDLRSLPGRSKDEHQPSCSTAYCRANSTRSSISSSGVISPKR